MNESIMNNEVRYAECGHPKATCNHQFVPQTGTRFEAVDDEKNSESCMEDCKDIIQFKIAWGVW